MTDTTTTDTTNRTATETEADAAFTERLLSRYAENETQYRREWENLPSFEALCAVNARYLIGEVKWCPGYLGEGVDPETKPLIPYLVALNQAGFLTSCSQPGELRAGYRQRAFVDGYATVEVVSRCLELELFTDLIVTAVPHNQTGGYLFPVTVDLFRPFTHTGHHDGRRLSAHKVYDSHMTPEGRAELDPLYYLTVIDPVWGREEYLWERLTQQLCYNCVSRFEEEERKTTEAAEAVERAAVTERAAGKERF
jgi:hypothetical protein